LLEIPESLFHLALRRAGQQGIFLQDVIIHPLQHELVKNELGLAMPQNSKRKLRPEFQRMWESGELSGGTDSTILISEEREGR
jgi:hypothetical protein